MTKTNTSEKRITLREYQDKLMSETLADLQVNMARGIVFPKNYVPQNALLNAVLYLSQATDKNGQPVLAVCTSESVKQALLDMLQAGLNVGKDQGYFIAYGRKLTWFTSYFGRICQAKAADPNIDDIFAEIVYQDDDFRYEIRHGRKVITEHHQDADNIDSSKIKGAYATVLYKDGKEVTEYMTIGQIRKSWSFGQQKGNGQAHRETPEEMCKRTVINRLTKPIINASNDGMVIDQAQVIDQEADEHEAEVMIDVGNDDDEIVESESAEELTSELEPEKKAPIKPENEPVQKSAEPRDDTDATLPFSEELDETEQMSLPFPD